MKYVSRKILIFQRLFTNDGDFFLISFRRGSLAELIESSCIHIYNNL